MRPDVVYTRFFVELYYTKFCTVWYDTGNKVIGRLREQYDAKTILLLLMIFE